LLLLMARPRFPRGRCSKSDLNQCEVPYARIRGGLTKLLASLLAAAFALGGLTACGGSVSTGKTVLNTEDVERAIEKSIREQRHLDARVTCPVNIEQRKGNDFSCFADVRGKRFEFRVTQTDDDGHVTYLGV